jgi:hypothetical protein
VEGIADSHDDPHPVDVRQPEGDHLLARAVQVVAAHRIRVGLGGTMQHAVAHFFGSFFTLQGFDNFGWVLMRVITIGTLVAIASRLIPRRTR